MASQNGTGWSFGPGPRDLPFRTVTPNRDGFGQVVDDQKGYGFILVRKNGSDVFVHFSDIGRRLQDAAQGQEVRFRVKQGTRARGGQRLEALDGPSGLARPPRRGAFFCPPTSFRYVAPR